jgi:DNA polymerase
MCLKILFSKMTSGRIAQMKKILNEVTTLKKLPLYKYRVRNDYVPVIGDGSLFSKIMFIGEAPGKNEAITGRAFCGKSGKVLDALFDSINFERKDAYVTSVVKDRPPENRDPTKKEIEVYAPFLDRQIDIIKPKIIATLGRFSMEYVMRRYGLESLLGPISALHGKVFVAKMPWGNVKVIPLYHPAVAVYNSNQMETLKADFAVLKNAI